MPVQNKYSILFLSLFLGVLLVSNFEAVFDTSNGLEIILETDLEWDKESEDFKIDTEDVDKIVVHCNYHLLGQKKGSRSYLYLLGNSLIKEEVILPPPEMKS